MSFPSDLEIARKAELKPLGIIAKESGIPEESLELCLALSGIEHLLES